MHLRHVALASLLTGPGYAQEPSQQVLRGAAAEHRAAHEAGRGWTCQPPSVPGVVTDSRGRPVSGALVLTQLQTWSPEALASTHTGPDGRFRLSSPLPDVVWIEALAPGFIPRGHGGLTRCQGGGTLVLRRDTQTLAAALAQGDRPEARLELALELSLLDGLGAEDLPVAFPLIGALRPELLRITRDETLWPALTQGAARMLRLWGAPADVASWSEPGVPSALSSLIGLTRPDLELLLAEVGRVAHAPPGGAGPLDLGDDPMLVVSADGERALWCFWVMDLDTPFTGFQVQAVVERHAGRWMVVQADIGAELTPSLDGY